MKIKSILAFVLTVLALTGRAAEWPVAASFDATKPADLTKAAGGTEYVYSTGEIPVAALPAESRERQVVFGSQLVLAWSGARPEAHYRIKAAFLSDSAERVLSVDLNGRPLAEKLSLPAGKVLEQTWEVPAGTVTDGGLTVTIGRVSGANAVLSRLEVLADRPVTLVPPPPLAEALAGMAVPMPPLSPRPAALPGVKTPLLTLSGTWKFNPAPPEGFAQFDAARTRRWASMEVPGEWVMQGFEVKSNGTAAYWREFEVPADWAGRRIKLRFDTVHSDCQVFVNGRTVGAHEGCFTAFELDVTDAVKPGRNTLALAVKSDSISDTLASASQYAAHALGGITRKVELFALPAVNVAEQIATTTFDGAFKDATLKIHLATANESGKANEAAVRFTLADGSGAVVTKADFVLPVPALGQNQTGDFSIPVAAPKKWDSEHPYLYTLKTELLEGAAVAEVITQRVGFRQIEIRGNRLFVNGAAVKLRGACRHEVDPVRGRSLTPERWRQDAELFRAANVNYIRTSHYPPAEEFLDLCDEYGFYVECEAPLCWVQHGANPIWGKWNYLDPRLFSHLMRANLENLAANRGHPCVTIWSLANESRWSPLFAEVNRRVKQADPTRPTSFHDQCWGGYNNAHSEADIAVYHYPGENGPAKCDTETRPVLFGEYCHVECYNRRELATDPGVRDDWGRGFARMNELMYAHEGCLGGAIWAGIDDVFCLPNGKFVGYGMWGSICDGWRRDKPETWHVKKTYAPVRVTADQLPLPAAGMVVRVPVENRYNFADLSEVGISWSLGRFHGTALAAVPARQRGEVVIPPPATVRAGDRLHLVFTDPRGFVCNEEEVVLGPTNAVPEEWAVTGTTADGLAVTSTDRQITIRGGEVAYVIDRQTGQFVSGQLDGKTFLTGGPALMVLPLQTEECEPVDLGIWKPLNNVAEDWRAESIGVAAGAGGTVDITVSGTNALATGGYVIRLDAAGGIRVTYGFKMLDRLNPRQWGVVFFTPKGFDTLAWNRTAQWSYYPPGHIGRAAGTAVAQVAKADRPYAVKRPANPWSLDATALGGNDFTSTKVAIRLASLADGSRQLRVTSDGHQAVRAFVAGRQAGLLVAGFHTGGGDGFFGTHLAAERRPLKPGSPLADTVQLRLTDE